MKKLMIATAAIALGASGAFATDNCCDKVVVQTGATKVNVETVTCDAHVYEVKMTLKTLAAKRITKDGCDAVYFDKGTRKINGYIWTCCDPCDALASAEEYQITLWDATAKVPLFQTVSRGGSSASVTTNTKYQATATYKIASNNVTLDKTVDIGTFTEAQVLATNTVVDATNVVKTAYNKAVDDAKAKAEAEAGYVAGSWTYAGPTAVPEVISTAATDEGWVDTNYADVSMLECELTGSKGPFLRYGKTANSVAMAFAIQNTTSVGDYDLYAAGLGSFDTKKMIAKSASGSVAGVIPSLEFCDDWACFADPCEEFETWCDHTATDTLAIPAYGTWTMKYVSKLKSSLYNTVPTYDQGAL